MPITAHIDSKNQRIVATVEGSFSTREILEVINASVSDEEFSDGFDILSDHRTVTKVIQPEQVKAMGAELQSLVKRFDGARWAIIIGASELQYGMMRMVAAFAGAARIEVRIFDDAERATEWLDTARGRRAPAGPRLHDAC